MMRIYNGWALRERFVMPPWAKSAIFDKVSFLFLVYLGLGEGNGR